MKLVILAGGLGQRLGLVDRPKPMVELAGKPLLEWQILLARRYGFKEIILLTGHLSDVIENYFGDGAGLGLDISYFREETPLGTAGAFPRIRGRLGDGRFLVFYGDVAMDFDISRFVAFDAAAGPSLGTLLVHPNNHPHDSDLLEIDAQNRVTAMHPKPRPAGLFFRNLVNAGAYILSPEIIAELAPDQAADWGREVFPRLLASGGRLMAYQTPEYLRDLGTPERFAAIEGDWRSGRVAARNLEKPQRAVFLDRDGVLNFEVDNLSRLEDLRLVPGAAEAVRLINQSGFLCLVVTNQPVLAKGWLDEAGLARLHAKLETLLGLEGAYLDAIYYCPHHPDKGFPGERPELKIDCGCRKPKPGLILAAARDFNVSLADSALIGDSERDIKAGQAAGLPRNVLVPANAEYALLRAAREFLEEAA